MNKLFDNENDAANFLINLNRSFFLDNKEHIKKYYKVRKIHADVLNSMMDYIDSGKLPIEKYFNILSDDIRKEAKDLKFALDSHEYNDAVVFNELFIYKTHYKIPSLTEIYIEKKKFRNAEKVKMLYAMRDSIVGLFKIVGSDHTNGYVTYQDVFTHKKYKIIDISMSSIGDAQNTKGMYVYNRIINYDGILFGTGIPCILTDENKRLRHFLKHHKYNKCSDFSRCLMLYDIARDNDNGIHMVNYHNY